MQIHLDLLGGLAGDMFIAGLLDAFPEHEAAVVERIASFATRDSAAASPRSARVVAFNDGVLDGCRFDVGDEAAPAVPGNAPEHEHVDAGDHAHPHDEAPSRSYGMTRASTSKAPKATSAHGHVAWASIRRRLVDALPAAVATHALGIFGVLAEAEAQVHGVAVDDVEFHEVGAWDSIADIVGAAVLIDRIGATRWTTSAVPLGSGRVMSAHGPMPVPAPATALLLRGYPMLDDGIGGERVTPTGAAILRYLVAPRQDVDARPAPRLLLRSGVGFGTRRLPGISNCVRVLVFEEVGSPASAGTGQHRELAVIEFEVDDQSAEDLSIGLERLRKHDAIFDVIQAPVFGKKGRMMTAVRLLARPTSIDDAIEACFRETTTIGLRHRLVNGAALPRRADMVEVHGRSVRVKTVQRPGGATVKAESDDALIYETHRERRQLRDEAERVALATRTEDDDA